MQWTLCQRADARAEEEAGSGEEEDFSQPAFGLAAAFGLDADLAFIRASVAGVLDVADVGTSEGPIILLATGTFNPPHRGHLEMIRVARDALAEAGGPVAGAILVPSSDDYVRCKVKEAGLDMSLAFSFHLRAKLLRATAADLGMRGTVHICDAEQSRGLFYLQVPASLAQALDKDQPKPRLIFVTGSDRPHPLLHRSRGLSGCVVVPRTGDNVSHLRAHVVSDPLRVVAEEMEGIADLSSTRLREALVSALQCKQREDAATRQTEVASVEAEDVAISALREFMTPSAARLCLSSISLRPRQANPAQSPRDPCAVA